MIYLIVINIIVVIAMLIMFLKASSMFKKIADNNGNIEIEGQEAKKYMKISIILAPISLILTTVIVLIVLL